MLAVQGLSTQAKQWNKPSTEPKYILIIQWNKLRQLILDGSFSASLSGFSIACSIDNYGTYVNEYH